MKIISTISKNGLDVSKLRAAPKRSGGGSEDGPGASKRSEDGSATVLFIALLAIMLLLVTANVRTLVQLRLEEKLVEQKQVQRLNPAQTNAVPTLRLEPK